MPCDWIDGADAINGHLEDMGHAAKLLAEFLKALRAVDPGGGPLPGERNFWRGIPLAERDNAVRAAIKNLNEVLAE